MEWMKPEFGNTFSSGKWVGWARVGGRGFTQCWHNIRKGGYLNDDALLERGEGGGRGEGGVENLGKNNYIINEPSLLCNS